MNALININFGIVIFQLECVYLQNALSKCQNIFITTTIISEIPSIENIQLKLRVYKVRNIDKGCSSIPFSLFAGLCINALRPQQENI